MQLQEIFKAVGIAGLVDIALVSILIYTLIVWFKRSRAVFVLIGLSIVGVVYSAARELNLQLMAAVFQGFFTVILIAIIVIFQEEIKHIFERVALWSLNRGAPRQQVLHLARREVEILVRTLTDLASDKIGALIVLHGKDPIVRHINGGVDLNGELSEAVLKSLFDPNSIGHDGALVIEGGHIVQFGCVLPLSKDLRKIPPGGGTRHAAALGLAELTDALCLVVSEERGTISAARDGEIEVVSDPEKLNLILHRYYEEMSPTEDSRQLPALFLRNWREKLISVGLAMTLWYFYVHEGRLTYEAFRVPVEYVNLPSGLQLQEMSPSEVDVTLSGPRRYFYLANQKRIRLVLNMVGAREGYMSKQIQKSNITFPEKLSLEDVNPAKVRLILRAK